MSNFFIRSYVKLLNSCRKMSSSNCKVAICQLTATHNKDVNLGVVKKLVSEAAAKDAKVVFLPEGCDYIGRTKEETQALAEPLTGTLMNEYKNLAKNLKIWLSIGGFHEIILCENNETKFFNSHVLINERGEIHSVYKKLHLFDVSIPELNVNLKESDVTQAGCEIVGPVDTPAGLLALSICYDLRFPELSTLLRKQGAQILTYPSAFTQATGVMHWEALLKARAIETQCYVVAAAQYGRHNDKRTSFGQALIVDPRGSIVAECPKYNESHESNESIAVTEIYPKLIHRIRTEMPVFQHRRSDLYELRAINKWKVPINDGEKFMFSDKIIPASTVFYRTRHSFAFTNIRCVVPGHVLIASIRQVKRLRDLTDEEVADLFQAAVKVEKVLENIHSSDSSTVCVQDGKNAGQTIEHVHIHILPRHPNDFERNDDIYTHLAKHDRDNNLEPMRPIEEMIAEAISLRQYFI